MEKRETLELLTKIEKWLEQHKKVLISYSGGVDSSLLAALAKRTKGVEFKCVMVVFPMISQVDLCHAQAVAQEIGFAFETQAVDFLNTQVAENTPKRCYFCKRGIGKVLLDITQRDGFACVVDGQNWDDRSEIRPGSAAATELGIISPFQELQVTKKQIRELSRFLGLSTADAPSSPCLATRVETGTPITADRIKLVETAEMYLRGLGFQLFRVRLYRSREEDCARIELCAQDWEKIYKDHSLLREIDVKMRALGFMRVSVDLSILVRN